MGDVSILVGVILLILVVLFGIPLGITWALVTLFGLAWWPTFVLSFLVVLSLGGSNIRTS